MLQHANEAVRLRDLYVIHIPAYDEFTKRKRTIKFSTASRAG